MADPQEAQNAFNRLLVVLAKNDVNMALEQGKALMTALIGGANPPNVAQDDWEMLEEFKTAMGNDWRIVAMIDSIHTAVTKGVAALDMSTMPQDKK